MNTLVYERKDAMHALRDLKKKNPEDLIQENVLS